MLGIQQLEALAQPGPEVSLEVIQRTLVEQLGRLVFAQADAAEQFSEGQGTIATGHGRNLYQLFQTCSKRWSRH